MRFLFGVLSLAFGASLLVIAVSQLIEHGALMVEATEAKPVDFMGGFTIVMITVTLLGSAYVMLWQERE